MSLNSSEPKEPNPREFTRVCALELYLFGVSFVAYLALCGPICAYLALCGPKYMYYIHQFICM